MRIAGLVNDSIVDGPGIRFSVFAQGCPHHCKGCHNETTHDFSGGYDCELTKILTEIDKPAACRRDVYRRRTFLPAGAAL
jgi:anaerobic ribonucleoside-triphosphate reductase activating protein